MDILTARFEGNEIAKSEDYNFIETQEYSNLVTIFEELFSHATNDIIVAGLNVQQRGTPSMNVDFTIGLGYCRSTGKVAHTGSLFGPISITNGGASARIDTLEVRVLETDYDSQQRAFKNPVTKDISYQNIYTKKRYELEAQVINGIVGAGVAPTHTAGWVKIAEITVDTGESTSILDADIENCTSGYDTEVTANWTTETAATFRMGSVSDFKTLFRISHNEDGSHSNDTIKTEDIDWGLGASQVKAIDMAIADAGGRITATEVENALQEIAGAGRTVENIKGNADNINTHKAIDTNSAVVHGARQGTGNSFNADKVDGADAGNASGNVGLANGSLCVNLNSEMWGSSKKTVSINDPSGGADGDMWFKY